MMDGLGRLGLRRPPRRRRGQERDGIGQLFHGQVGFDLLGECSQRKSQQVQAGKKIFQGIHKQFFSEKTEFQNVFPKTAHRRSTHAGYSLHVLKDIKFFGKTFTILL